MGNKSGKGDATNDFSEDDLRQEIERLHEAAGSEEVLEAEPPFADELNLSFSSLPIFSF